MEDIERTRHYESEEEIETIDEDRAAEEEELRHTSVGMREGLEG